MVTSHPDLSQDLSQAKMSGDYRRRLTAADFDVRRELAVLEQGYERGENMFWSFPREQYFFGPIMQTGDPDDPERFDEDRSQPLTDNLGYLTKLGIAWLMHHPNVSLSHFALFDSRKRRELRRRRRLAESVP